MPQDIQKLDFPARRHDRGLSLVELSVVVLIILVLVAVAIPNMSKARMKANEASALVSVRAIQSAEVMYSNAYPAVGFAGNLADLGPHGTDCQITTKVNSCLIMDTALTSGIKNGYTFDLVGDGATPTRGYTLTATPISANASGRCSLIADQSGQIVTSVGTSNNNAHFSQNAGNGSGCGT